MANPTWLSLHCLNGMNLLVPFSDAKISIRCKLYHVCCHFEASRGGAFFSAFLFHGRDHLCSSWRTISRLDRWSWNCTDEGRIRKIKSVIYIFSPTSTSSATTLGLSDICLNIFKNEMWMMGFIHMFILVYWKNGWSLKLRSLTGATWISVPCHRAWMLEA